MLLSIEWLKDYVDLSGCSAAQISEYLTNLGIEVEGSKNSSPLDPLIVVGKILSVQTHPDAKKLSVCQVDVGTSQSLSIVCGVPNWTSANSPSLPPKNCAGINEVGNSIKF